MISERNQTGMGIIIGLLILWLVSVVIKGEEAIEDLGMVTKRKGIVLERDTNRTDFIRFEIEIGTSFIKENTTITIIRTNDLLTLEDFGMVSDGRILMGVKSVYADGDESPVALFRVEIRRTGLTKPRARGITIAGLRTNRANLHEILQERKNAMTNAVGAPMPYFFDSGSGYSRASVVTPMRGGTNKTYAEHMAEYFNRSTRK